MTNTHHTYILENAEKQLQKNDIPREELKKTLKQVIELAKNYPKAAEKKCEHDKKLQALVLNEIPQAFVVVDNDLNITLYNQIFISTFDLAADNITGTNLMHDKFSFLKPVLKETNYTQMNYSGGYFKTELNKKTEYFSFILKPLSDKFSILFFENQTPLKENERKHQQDKFDLMAIANEREQEIVQINEELSSSNEELRVLNEKLSLEAKQHEITRQVLAESETKFRSFIEQSTDGILFIDENAKIIESNNKIAQMVNLTKEQITGMYIWDFDYRLLVDERKTQANYQYIKNAVLKYLEHIPDSAKPLKLEGQLQLGDKHIFLSSTIFPVVTEKNKFVGRITRDISNQKSIENQLKNHKEYLEELVDKRNKELKQSEEKYRALFENAQNAIVLLKNNRFIDFNSKALEIYGYSRSELFNKAPYELAPKHQPNGQLSKELALEKIHQCLQGTIDSFEFQHKNKTGTLIDVEVSLNALTLGKTNYIQAIVHDISMRKAFLNALHESEKKFRDIFNNSSDAILISDMKNNILEVNKTFIEALGFSYTQILQSTLNAFVQKRDLQLIEKNKQELSGNEPSTFELEIKTKDGLIIPVEIKSRLINYKGKPSILSIIRDITERKEMESKILSAIIDTEEKQRKMFSEELHDDLGPLLSSIKMYVKSIVPENDKTENNESVNGLFEVVDESIVTLKRISHMLSPHMLNDYGLLAAIDSFASKIAQSSGMEIDITANQEMLNLDKKLEIVLYRIITELINNTIKHAEAKHIHINIIKEEQLLSINYKDNGKGFDLNKILSGKKRGLGLFNIENRIKSFNGTFDIKTQPNKGLEAKIDLKL